MGRNPKTPADKTMPEYQMFPVGMWHMLAAVMLMVFCIAITLILAIFASLLYRSRPYLDGVEHYRLIWAHDRSNKQG